MMDVLIAVALLAMGFWLGQRQNRKTPLPPSPEEQELERLREDRAAFARLMGYNIGQAYGQEEP